MPHRNITPGFVRDRPPAADRLLAVNALELEHALAEMESDNDDAAQDAYDRSVLHLHRLAGIRAESIAGLKTKARTLIAMLGDELKEGGLEFQLLRSLLDDIARLADAARPASDVSRMKASKNGI